MARLEVRALSKRFGATQALDQASLSLHAGEILALIGENGAGKSTLIKLLAGIHQPDAGEFLLDGQRARPSGPAAAIAAGIVLVPQELRVVPGLTVGENLLLGRLPIRRIAGFLPALDKIALHAKARELLDTLQLQSDPHTPVADLDFAQRQLLVIARALGSNARILILDEPTASLETREVERLFEVVRLLRAQSVSVIYVSHRLDEVNALADRCIVMRDGRVAMTLDAPPYPTAILADAMTGGTSNATLPRHTRNPGSTVMTRFVAGNTMSCRQGEVLGLAGLLGSGTSALLNDIFTGADESGVSTRRSIASGIGMVSGERTRSLVMSMSVRDNIVLAHLHAFTRAFGRDEARIDKAVRELLEQLDIRPRNPSLPVHALSGGNQQKVSFARWLIGRLDLLLLDEPTSGIDIGAKALIHARIADFAADGGAVLLSSSDTPELLALSDAIVVMRRGRLEGRLERENGFDEQQFRRMLEVAPMKQKLGDQIPALVLLALCVFSAFASDRFLSAANLSNVLLQAAVLAVITIGMTWVIIGGGFDLSVGSIVALSGCIGAEVMLRFGIAAGVSAGMLAGLAVGLVNGGVIAWLRVSPFIATLGTMVLVRGVVLLFTHGAPVSGEEGLPEGFVDYASARLLGLPLLVWTALALFLVFHWGLHRTAWGTRVFAVGGNREAAYLSGIAVRRITVSTYAISGLTGGIAGMMLASRLESGQPTAGEFYELNAIAAVVLGGAALQGGEGRLYKSMIGVLIMTVLANSLNLMGVDSYWQRIAIGLVIVAAAAADQARRHRA